MITVLIEAAVRSAVLILAVWLLLRALRVTNPRVERAAWLVVLIASVAMPSAVSNPIVTSVPQRSLSMVFGTPMTASL